MRETIEKQSGITVKYRFMLFVFFITCVFAIYMESNRKEIQVK
jgi:hypothetical protein